jgi:hypothetical protein
MQRIEVSQAAMATDVSIVQATANRAERNLLVLCTVLDAPCERR